jgi:Domain of unknown function (DUF4416)
MADPSLPDAALLVIAIFSRHSTALAWAEQQLQTLYGPIGIASKPYLFNQTAYYESEMGSGLQKRLLAFRDLINQDRLAAIKVETNRLEEELARTQLYAEARPLNIDPGVLTLGKFLLGTTKDQAHRIYLRDGIYAEVTLRFQAGAFEPWPWTYADYRQDCVREFLKRARDFYREQVRRHAGESSRDEPEDCQ